MFLDCMKMTKLRELTLTEGFLVDCFSAELRLLWEMCLAVHGVCTNTCALHPVTQLAAPCMFHEGVKGRGEDGASSLEKRPCKKESAALAAVRLCFCERPTCRRFFFSIWNQLLLLLLCQYFCGCREMSKYRERHLMSMIENRHLKIKRTF